MKYRPTGCLPPAVVAETCDGLALPKSVQILIILVVVLLWAAGYNPDDLGLILAVLGLVATAV